MMRLALLLVLTTAAGAAEAPSEFQKSAALFQSKCAKCHTVGKGDRVGPDLKGVTVRRTPEWLSSFLKKPSALLERLINSKLILQEARNIGLDALPEIQAEQKSFAQASVDDSSSPPQPARMASIPTAQTRIARLTRAPISCDYPRR